MTETTQELHDKYEPRPDVSELTGDASRADNIRKRVDYEPHPEKSVEVSPEHQNIIDSIERLYSGSSSEQDMQVYSEKAIYDDPYSYCDTRYKIAGQWYGLPKVCIWRSEFTPSSGCLSLSRSSASWRLLKGR